MLTKYVERVIEIADQGLVALPERVNTLRAARDRIQANAATLRSVPDTYTADIESTEKLISAVVDASMVDDAALAGIDWTIPRTQRAADEDARSATEAMAAAVDRIDEMIGGVIASTAEATVLGMQEKFGKVVVEYAAGLKLAAEWPTESARLLASAKVRATLAARHELRGQLDSMLLVRECLRSLGYRSTVDEAGEFGLLTNLSEVWPRGTRSTATSPPWRDGDRFDWFLSSGGRAWLPTVPEQDALFNEVDGPGIAAAAANRRAYSGMVTGGGSAPQPSYMQPAVEITTNPSRPPVTPRAKELGERFFGKTTDDE